MSNSLPTFFDTPTVSGSVLRLAGKQQTPSNFHWLDNDSLKAQIPDRFHGLSDSLMILLCSTAGFVCMVC